MAVERISARDARAHVEANSALLVCAYDNDEKFNQNHLEGAISLRDFRSQIGTFPKDKEIIFYCA